MTPAVIESVKDLLLRRMRSGSTPGRRDDGRHLALVIEGGGMRGVVSGGMVSGLEDFALADCFDTIHGSSAGACAGAYFLAGQAALGTSIYFEDINNGKFIDLFGWLKGRPVMSTSFLIDYVMRRVKVMDVDRIVASLDRLHVVATDVATGAPYRVSRFKDADDFFLLLKASITIPLIAGFAVAAHDRKLVDGGMTQQIALDSARAVGATHILVLMTHCSDQLTRPSSNKPIDLTRWAIRAVYGETLADRYRARNDGINKTMETILGRRAGDSLIDFIVRPPQASYVSRLCKDAGLLRTAAGEARAAVHDYIGADAASGGRVSRTPSDVAAS